VIGSVSALACPPFGDLAIVARRNRAVLNKSLPWNVFAQSRRAAADGNRSICLFFATIRRARRSARKGERIVSNPIAAQVAILVALEHGQLIPEQRSELSAA